MSDTVCCRGAKSTHSHPSFFDTGASSRQIERGDRILCVPAFLGIVIEQSLADPAFAETLDVSYRKRDPNGSWVFLLVRIAPEQLSTDLERIRQAIARDEPWYAHFFSDDRLAVVFTDAVFELSTDPASWSPAIEHGLALGIPREQLDFWPRTVEQIEEMLGISLADLG